MKIAIVGTGYVGLVSAACFAELGHDVIGVDIDAAKVALLQSGKSPIYEPGLEELLKSGLKTGRLSFTTKLEEALPHVKIVFSAVATPTGEDFKADLRSVFIVAEAVATHINHDVLFVNKSTVPVGTGKKCEDLIRKTLKDRGVDFHVPVVSNPEFLREGMAVSDTMMPDRIVVGMNAEPSNLKPLTYNLIEELYRPITRVGKPLLFMSRESAEIVKYASNAFLATKISFINMLTPLCEITDANIRDVAKGMGLDNRIGPKFLHAGIGYGGSCFPKDVKALLATGKEYGVPMPIIEATDSVNKRQREQFIEKVLKSLRSLQEKQSSPPLSGEGAKLKVAIWGLSFKPKTDDMREAPSIDVLQALDTAGYAVTAYDPVTMEKAKPLLPASTSFATSALDAAKNADAVILLTEWDEFRGVDLKEVKATMRGKLLFDGRNVYEPDEVKEAGLVYRGIGTETR